MSDLSFKCKISNKTEFTDLGIEMWLDNTKFYDSKILPGQTPIEYNFSEDESDHVLSIVLKNKTVKHTTIGINGNIESDAVLEIQDITLDEIALGQKFYDIADYTHDYNGSENWITEKFYGTLGCNGTVKFTFYTPFYRWLMEHM